MPAETMPSVLVALGTTSPPATLSLSLSCEMGPMISLSPGDNKRMGEIICAQCQVPRRACLAHAWDLEASSWSFTTIIVVIICVPSYLTVRKQEIIKVTEQLIEAISNGDFESYT